MAIKKATIEYLQKLIQSIKDYSAQIRKEEPYCLKNTSWFFVEKKISHNRFKYYTEEDSIDLSIRRQIKDEFCYLTACLDVANQKYLYKCKKEKKPFTPEELIAWKRYHKSLDSWAYDREHENRMAEKAASRNYELEGYCQ